MAEVINIILGGPGGLKFGNMGKIIMKGLGRGPVIAGPERRFYAGHRMHSGHALVILGGSCDHMDMGLNYFHWITFFTALWVLHGRLQWTSAGYRK